MVGFGFCCSRLEEALGERGLGFGPVGSTEKYFGYLNSWLTSSANSDGNTFPFCITTGIAGATMLARSR